MSFLKKDTTPVDIETLKRLRFRLNPWEYTVVKTDSGLVMVIRSGKDEPDIIEDLEMIMDTIDERDIDSVSSACLLGMNESINLNISVLWSIIDRRNEKDRKIVEDLKKKMDRNYGVLLFTLPDDKRKLYRLAIRIPYPIRVIVDDNIPELFSDLELPKHGEIVYIIGDDGYRRYSGRKFFKILEESQKGPVSSGGVVRAMEEVPEPEEVESGEEDMTEFMPKITLGGKKEIGVEDNIELSDSVGDTDQEEVEFKPVEESTAEVMTDEAPAEELESADVVEEEEELEPVDKIEQVSREEQTPGTEGICEYFRRNGFACTLAEIEGVDGIVQFEAKGRVYRMVWAYRDSWTPRELDRIHNIAMSRGYDGAIAISRKFSLDDRIFIVGRAITLLELDEIERITPEDLL